MRSILCNIILTIVVSFSFLGFCNRSLCAEPDQKLHQKCLYPTVLVSPADKQAYGSGVILRSVRISDGEYRNVFITCAHVADETSPYVVKVFQYKEWSRVIGSKTYPCVFYAKDEKRDLAIGVFLSDEEMPTAEADFDTRLYIGTDVFGIGCGVGDEPRLDTGKVSSVRTKLKSLDELTIRSSVHTVPGDSGSPLFHNYKVVGIRVAIRVYRGLPVFNMSYTVPLEHLQTWNEEAGRTLEFAWRNKALPRMPFHRLRMEITYETIEEKK